MRGPLKTLKNRIAEIRLHTNFINEVSEVSRGIAPYVNRPLLANNATFRAAYEAHYRNTKHIRADDIRAGFIVQAFAAFEWYISAVLRAAAESIDSKTVYFHDLPGNIAQAHITLSGRALMIQCEAKQHWKVNVDAFCKRLGGCHTASDSFELNSHAFGLFIPNINSSSVDKMLLRVGFELNWDKIGGEGSVKKLTGETSARKAGNQARAEFDRLSRRRNEIAHQGDGSIVASKEELDLCLQLLTVVGEHIASGIEKSI